MIGTYPVASVPIASTVKKRPPVQKSTAQKARNYYFRRGFYFR